MDGLNNEERVEAWKAAWNISLTGMALVTEDFHFHRVNDQWLKILDVSAAEFYGRTFSDITPLEIRDADEAQAKLVIEGKITSYLMHKSYKFTNGEEKRVTLLVTRIPMDGNKPFQYFLSRILTRPPTIAEKATYASSLQSPRSTQDLIKFVYTYGKWIAGIGIFFGALILKYFGDI